MNLKPHSGQKQFFSLDLSHTPLQPIPYVFFPSLPCEARCTHLRPPHHCCFHIGGINDTVMQCPLDIAAPFPSVPIWSCHPLVVLLTVKTGKRGNWLEFVSSRLPRVREESRSCAKHVITTLLPDHPLVGTKSGFQDSWTYAITMGTLKTFYFSQGMTTSMNRGTKGH